MSTDYITTITLISDSVLFANFISSTTPTDNVVDITFDWAVSSQYTTGTPHSVVSDGVSTMKIYIHRLSDEPHEIKILLKD